MNQSEVTIGVTGQTLVEKPVANLSGVLQRQMAGCGMLFANLEATVTAPHAWPVKPRTLHVATPETIASLAALGISDLGHANNHAFDLGPPGIAAAHTAAGNAGLSLAGSGADLAGAARPTLRMVAGVRVAILAADCGGANAEIVYAARDRAGINPLRVNRTLVVPPDDHARFAALLAATGEDKRQAGRMAVGYRDILADGTLDFFGIAVECGEVVAEMRRPDAADLERMHAGIAAARAVADIVLVSLHHHHWMPIWSETPAWFAALARDLIDQGADMIVGTGPPVLQPITFHRGRPIFAGLGNFIFHTHRPKRYDAEGIDVWSGAVCLCRFDGSGCAGIDIAPVAVSRLGSERVAPAPAALSGGEAEAVFARLAGGLTAEEQARVRLAA